MPFLICVLLGVTLLLIRSGPENEGFINQDLLNLIITVISYSVYTFYIILANIRLFSYSRVIKNNFSDLEKINLIWLRIFILLLTLFLIFAAIADLIFKVENWDLIWLVSCLLIYVISYVGLIQPVIFSEPLVEKTGRTDRNGKYLKSSLDEQSALKYLKMLESMMAENKIYLDNTISLSRLSKEANIPLHHLSQIINERVGQNFYDYINAQRIEEAKRRLNDPQYGHLSIAAVGFDVGFNSQSAFYTAFKKFSGQTPSQYRNQ
jgi:AraC-like DNA-binding protein